MSQLRKRFGQHLLTDNNIIERIITTIAPAADDKLVEIGPGKGALTQPLYEKLNELHAVEFDRDFVQWLQELFLSRRFILHESDALTFNFASLTDLPHSLRVVGNLPYNISTPLIFHLLKRAESIRDMHFMLQKEVVERMTASPGNKHWGRLSVMVQYACQADHLFNVPPGAFTPPPKVNSAVVRLIPHRQIPCPAIDFTLFETLVRQAFSQRRKTIRNGVKYWLDSDAIQASGVNPATRPEQLSVAQLVALANTASKPDK